MKSTGAFVISVLPALGMGIPAMAQDNSDDIVVTAQRREQRLSDVGMSITALGSETLENRNVADVSGLASLVPGLSVGDTGYGAPIYTLRGVGVNEPSLGAASSVAIYVDEVPLAYPVMTLGATLDLSRIEVLKGPQGTLYGQNSTGGAINYIANKPTDEFEAGVTGSFARFNKASLEGFVSGPLSPTLRARVAVRTIQGGAWQRSITRDDELGDSNRFVGRAILQWDPSEDFSATLNLNGFVDKSDTLAPQLIRVVRPGFIPEVALAPIPGDNARSSDWDPGDAFKADDYFYQASLRAEWHFSDALTLTSISTYSKHRRRSLNEFDGMALQTNRYRLDGSIEALAQEVRLNADLSGSRWIIGANVGHDNVNDDQFQQLRFSSSGLVLGNKFDAITNDADQQIRSWAVFTNIEVPLTDRITVSGGIRLSQETRRFQACNRDPGSGDTAFAFTNLANTQRAALGLPPIAPIPPGGCVTLDANSIPGLFRSELKENNVPWNVNVNWKPAHEMLIYGRVSRGFKSGNFASLGAGNQGAYTPVVQEKLTAYELGARLSVDRIFRVEGAIFRYDYINKQLRARTVVPVFGNVQAQVNIPKSRIKGAELSAVLSPVRDLNISLSGVYLDANITKYVGFNVDSQIIDHAGKPFTFTPKYSLNGDVTYSRDIGDDLSLFGGVNISYRSHTVAAFAASSEFDIPKYTLIDAQLGIETKGRWKVWIWGKNITDKYYWTNVTRNGPVDIKFPAMPATYGISASYKF
jgi:iron complex outermembrane recepter protein